MRPSAASASTEPGVGKRSGGHVLSWRASTDHDYRVTSRSRRPVCYTRQRIAMPDRNHHSVLGLVSGTLYKLTSGRRRPVCRFALTVVTHSPGCVGSLQSRACMVISAWLESCLRTRLITLIIPSHGRVTKTETEWAVHRPYSSHTKETKPRDTNPAFTTNRNPRRGARI
jgi:hypothetical protein